MDKTDRLRDYGLAFLLYKQGLSVCGYELIRELFIFIKLILNSYLDAAIQIIERYKPLRKDMHLFNIGSLDMVNKRIKKVAKMCGIKKRISFHVSRHSFAVLALNYGMPIESVSKILGHTDIATTQIYAKVTSTKLEHDISAFESRIKGHMPTMGGMA